MPSVELGSWAMLAVAGLLGMRTREYAQEEK